MYTRVCVCVCVCVCVYVYVCVCVHIGTSSFQVFTLEWLTEHLLRLTRALAGDDLEKVCVYLYSAPGKA